MLGNTTLTVLTELHHILIIQLSGSARERRDTDTTIEFTKKGTLTHVADNILLMYAHTTTGDGSYSVTPMRTPMGQKKCPVFSFRIIVQRCRYRGIPLLSYS